MKFELGYIESLIESKEFLSPVNEVAAAGGLVEFSAELVRVRVAIKDHVFACDSTAMIERYIQDSQRVLLRLMNRVLAVDSNKCINVAAELVPTPTALLRVVYIHLEGLLLYLETYFGKYFDSNLDVPAGYAHVIVRDVGEVGDLVLAALKKHDVDGSMTETIREAIDGFLNHTMPGARTYRSLRYMKDLSADLMRVCFLGDGTEDMRQQIASILFYHNLNSTRFFQCYTGGITRRVNTLGSYVEKIDVYNHEAKLLRQLTCREDIVYDNRNKSIKVQLLAWIEGELWYLRETQQYQMPVAIEAEVPSTREYKLSVGISVAQLACIIRAMVETGVIQNKNIMELARYIPEMIRVKQKETFSPVSFRHKYYNVEYNTNQSVIDVLQRMMGVISKFD